MVRPYAPKGFSLSSGVNSATSPSYTSFLSCTRRPMARRKFSISASVFFTSALYTSLPVIRQKGTLVPSSWLTANASAVFPVPGPPASSTALPAIFFARIRSTTTPHASRALVWPTKPWLEVSAVPSDLKPRPLIWECAAVRFSRELD